MWWMILLYGIDNYSFHDDADDGSVALAFGQIEYATQIFHTNQVAVAVVDYVVRQAISRYSKHFRMK